MLSQDEILQARQKYGVPADGIGTSGSLGGSTGNAGAGSGWFAEAQKAWNPAPVAPQEHFKAGGVLGAIQDVAHGAAKSGTEHILQAGSLLERGLDQTAGRVVNAVRGEGFTPTHVGEDTQKAVEQDTGLVRNNMAEKVGAGIETVGEFAAPGGLAMKGEKLVQGASEALPGIWGAAARIAGKSAVQGATAGAVDYLETGGDLKDAAETAALAGATRGVLATIGEGAKALKIPERLYQTVFKNTKADMMSELKSEAFKDIQKNDPELFKKMLDEDLIHIGTDGAPVVNDTLAEKALDRGLRGSVSNMANQVVKGAAKSEISAREIARNYGGTVSLTEPQYQNVLREIAQEYDNVGFGEVSEEATKLADALKASNGEVDAETALALRRFLDRMRLASSYDKPVSKMSLTQANLKTLADAARKKINEVPGMKDVMKDYSFYIDALDALAQHAKRVGNNQILGMIDSIFLGMGLGTGNSAPFVAGIARKALNYPGNATRIGNAIKTGIQGPVRSAVIGAIASELTGQ